MKSSDCENRTLDDYWSGDPPPWPLHAVMHSGEISYNAARECLCTAVTPTYVGSDLFMESCFAFLLKLFCFVDTL